MVIIQCEWALYMLKMVSNIFLRCVLPYDTPNEFACAIRSNANEGFDCHLHSAFQQNLYMHPCMSDNAPLLARHEVSKFYSYSLKLSNFIIVPSLTRNLAFKIYFTIYVTSCLTAYKTELSFRIFLNNIGKWKLYKQLYFKFMRFQCCLKL